MESQLRDLQCGTQLLQLQTIWVSFKCGTC